MRTIDTSRIADAVYDLCVNVNTKINPDLKSTLESLLERERFEVARDTLSQMIENFEIAEEENLPICQDTGMVVIFLEIGQDVHLEGEYLETAINEAVKRAYSEHYFRKSVVSDPLERRNTGTNTPAIIHTRIVPGEQVKITLTAKGFGSENTSNQAMLKPADGIEGVKSFIDETVKKAIPNGCAPLVVGIGIGGDFETSAINAKRALTIPVGVRNPKKLYSGLEEEIVSTANKTGIGPMGTGGSSSVIDAHIIEAATHIAGLPVAVNICCYVDRVGETVL